MTTWYSVFHKSDFDCPWCTKAIELLQVYGIDYYLKDINEDENKRQFLAAGHKTIPQIYRETELIGGHDKLVEHLRLQHSSRARKEVEAEKYGKQESVKDV